MEKTLDIAYDLFKVDLLWFEKYSTENPDLEELGRAPEDEPDDPENPMFVLNCEYDFDMNEKGEREFYMDTLVKLPLFAIMKIRVRYKIEATGDLEWEDLFTTERLKVLVENSMQNGFYHFRDQCAKNGIILPQAILENTPDLPSFQIDLVIENLIEDYFQYRQPFLKANAEYLRIPAVTLPPITNWQITLNLTLLVMDEVLFNNRHFNRINNRQNFFDIVPEHYFYSLRNKCVELKNKEVTLNQVEIHYFLIAQDCALQMAMGEKGDVLNEVMVSHGFVESVQKIWYIGASKLIELCRGSVKESIASGEKFDWSRMIY